MTSIVIIGAGTFGLSTALQLLRKGEKNVTIIDPYETPSPLSAGNDVNKILQSSVEEKFYSELALKSLDLWQNDPVFKPALHETGILYTTEKDFAYFKERKQFLDEKAIQYRSLKDQLDFTKLIPSVDDGSDQSKRFQKWEGLYQQEKCGWVYAAEVLRLIATEVKRLGGKFVRDAVDEILYDEKDNSVVGVRTYSGEIFHSNKVVVAAGAQSYRLLDFEGQLLAKCWTVSHIRLSPEQAEKLREIPVVLSLDHGFFFEPDSNNDLKICNEFPGYINWDDTIKESVPVYKNLIPKEAETYTRLFLKEVFPELSDKPFSLTKICWCTDTPDRHFLIGSHPDHRGLILGTGDSGQGFKFCPIVGHYISKVVLEGDEALDPLKREAWKWRPETAKNRDIFDVQGRDGGINIIKDLKDISEWTDGKDIGKLDINALTI